MLSAFMMPLAALVLGAPSDIPIQGQLRAPAGAPVDGAYDIVVRIYGSASGGSAVVSQSFTGVTVVDGVFSIALAGVQPGVMAGLATPFVGVAVQGELELPRRPIGAVPYALVAGQASSIACTGCIGSAALDPAVVALIESAYTDQQAVDAVVASGAVWTKTEVAGLAELLPPDGLDDVSGGLISTTFPDVFTSTDTPAPIKDNNPLGTGSTIDVPDVGIAKTITVNVKVSGHSDAAELVVTVFSPDGTPVVLHNKTGPGQTALDLTVPPTAPVSGSFAPFVGTNIKGSWRLLVVDSAFDTNIADGAIASWSITITTLSNKKLRITGDLDAEGHRVFNLGAPAAPGDAANKAYVDAAFKERTKTQEFLAVQAGATVKLTHGFGTSFFVSDAWYRAKTDQPWAKTGFTTPGVGNGASGAFAPTSNTTLAGGSYDYTSFNIPTGVTVTVTGPAPLVIRSLGTAIIAGTLNLAGGPGDSISTIGVNSTGGSGGGGGGASGGGCVYGGTGSAGNGSGAGAPGGSGSYGGGGGGGGHATAGTGGATNNNGCTTLVNGAGGNGYTSLDAGVLLGGSGGGAGGYGGAANAAGGGGGGGGGAMHLTASSILVTGTITANGGKGGDNLADRDGGGGGGGSGGVIWLVAGEVQIFGTVSAKGGAGGIADRTNCWGGDGGIGSDGRIRIDANGVSGSTTPVFTGTGINGGFSATPLRVYQESDNVMAIQNLSLTTLDIRAVVIAP